MGFSRRHLAGREVASYLISDALGWSVIPETVLRDGPAGPGMVQRWSRRSMPPTIRPGSIWSICARRLLCPEDFVGAGGLHASR